MSQPAPVPPPPSQNDIYHGQKNNGLAVASLVLGIVGILLQLFGVVNILAIVFGFVSKSQIDSGQGRGRGMAVAGIVLGFIGLALLIIVLTTIGLNPSLFKGN